MRSLRRSSTNESPRSSSLEIQPLLLEHVRMMPHLCPDRPDVLADDADEEELDRRDEEEADEDWGEAELELVPEQNLGYEIADGDEHREGSHREADHRRQSERHLRMMHDAEKCDVIEREEVLG